MLNGKIDLCWTLLSPLSHIGESVGPDSYLATQSILDPFGRPIEVFTYSGNAIRGMLRDSGAKYFLDNLSGEDATVQVPLEVFYLLWSGGAIGGRQTIDIDQARKIRQAVPHLSIFGGGVGNQILPGKLNVGDALPLCSETQHLLPENVREPGGVSWRAMTAERSYTRTDDAKDENKRIYLHDPESMPMLEGRQALLLADPDEEKKRQEKREKDQDRPQQMRYTVEVLQPGARLWSEIVFFDLLEIELGALTAAFADWAKRPVLGGKSNVGMGKVSLDATIILHGEEPQNYITVNKDVALFGDVARDSKRAYDEYLRKYQAYLAHNKEELVDLVGV